MVVRQVPSSCGVGLVRIHKVDNLTDIENFVQNIPSLDLSLEMSDEVGNVVLHNGNECCVGKGSTREPRWQLVVPDWWRNE